MEPLILIAMLTLSGWVLPSCGRDSTTDDTPDDGTGGGDGGGDGGGEDDGTCTTDTQCDDWEICEGDECVDGDRNNSIDEAETILWDATVTGYINPENDVDYWSFGADGGEFVRIATSVEFEEGNTVVVLRRPNGKVVAWADRFATETGVSGVDSVVFAYLADEGTYTISVEDDGSYFSYDEVWGDEDYVYELSLQEWSTTVKETDAFDDPNMNIDFDTDRMWTSVGVLFEEEGDIDYIALDYTVSGANLFIDGNQHMDGSDAVTRIRLLDESGQVYTDKSNVGPDHYALYPSLNEGRWIIEVSDSDGGGGDNHWAFVHLIARSDDPPFTDEEEPNDSYASATGLDLTEYENGNGDPYTLVQAQGFIDESDDADWFSFEAPYEEGYVVACLNSELWGSAVAPSIGVYDSNGDLMEEAEGSTSSSPNANIENVAVGSDTYFLKVTPPVDATGGPDNWYRFHIYVASFSVSSYEDGGYSCP